MIVFFYSTIDVQFVHTRVAGCMVPFPGPLYGCSQLFHLPINTVFLGFGALHPVQSVVSVASASTRYLLTYNLRQICFKFSFLVVIAAPVPGDIKKLMVMN